MLVVLMRSSALEGLAWGSFQRIISELAVTISVSCLEKFVGNFLAEFGLTLFLLVIQQVFCIFVWVFFEAILSLVAISLFSLLQFQLSDFVMKSYHLQEVLPYLAYLLLWSWLFHCLFKLSFQVFLHSPQSFLLSWLICLLRTKWGAWVFDSKFFFQVVVDKSLPSFDLYSWVCIVW